ncbi:MAG: GFA family protein [Alphaproteobacteria bacterium]|nr:GFA family protein [Alphaproteobacteria bacterium]
MSCLGSCYCGQVTVKISGDINSIIHCHCSKCRKASGTAYATNGVVKVDEFEITSGVEHIGKFGKVVGKYRYFCKICASPIYSSNVDDAAHIRIRLGILDGEVNERPMAHTFVDSKASWEDLDAGLPRYERYEPGR